MPAMAVRLTADWPMLGGLILAAPYAAAMSAVAGFLLLMSSSLVRDLYQRNLNPNVTERQVKWVSYGTTAVVGVLVTLLSLRPPQFLQYLILFTGAGMGCTYLAPTVLGALLAAGDPGRGAGGTCQRLQHGRRPLRPGVDEYSARRARPAPLRGTLPRFTC